MRRVLVTLAAAFFTSAHPLAAQECQIPVLRRGPDGFSLRFDTVPAGASKTLQPGQSERVITVIVPVSTGMSGDIVRGADTSALQLRCDDDAIRVFKSARGEGEGREVMTGDRDAYARYDIRVNVVSQDGVEAAFWIRDGRLGRADGPVIDMFKGMVPLEAGDVVVTTEIR